MVSIIDTYHAVQMMHRLLVYVLYSLVFTKILMNVKLEPRNATAMPLAATL